MILTGTIVNAAAIVAGGLLGYALKGIKPEFGRTLLQAMGLAVLVLGVSMGLKSDHFLWVILSLVIGGAVGEWLDLDGRLNRLGNRLEKRFSGLEQGGFSTAFVTTTLVYCVGSMAILGALDSGLRNDHQILYTKAMLDGFSAVIFASTLGIGVVFSAIPVFLYQGLIAIAASGIQSWIPDEVLKLIIQELTATGGILIMAIGINVLEIQTIKAANLLPALLVVAFLAPMAAHLF